MKIQEKNTKNINGFAKIPNTVLMTGDLSLCAIGLYCLISSVIHIPGYKMRKSTIQKKSNLGRDSFNRYWQELKEKGFLIQKELRNSKGMIEYEYCLLEHPEELETAPETMIEVELSDIKNTDNGFSDSGESNTHNKTNINNTFKNNIYNNNNIKNNLIDTINNNISSVVDSEKNIIKKERFNSFLNSLRVDELLPLAKLDKGDAISFAIAALNSYDNAELKNVEGFLRVSIKNIMGFIISGQNLIREYGYKPIFDAGNKEIIDYKLACYCY